MSALISIVAVSLFLLLVGGVTVMLVAKNLVLSLIHI